MENLTIILGLLTAILLLSRKAVRIFKEILAEED